MFSALNWFFRRRLRGDWVLFLLSRSSFVTSFVGAKIRYTDALKSPLQSGRNSVHFYSEYDVNFSGCSYDQWDNPCWNRTGFRPKRMAVYTGSANIWKYWMMFVHVLARLHMSSCVQLKSLVDCSILHFHGAVRDSTRSLCLPIVASWRYPRTSLVRRKVFLDRRRSHSFFIQGICLVRKETLRAQVSRRTKFWRNDNTRVAHIVVWILLIRFLALYVVVIASCRFFIMKQTVRISALFKHFFNQHLGGFVSLKVRINLCTDLLNLAGIRVSRMRFNFLQHTSNRNGFFHGMLKVMESRERYRCSTSFFRNPHSSSARRPDLACILDIDQALSPTQDKVDISTFPNLHAGAVFFVKPWTLLERPVRVSNCIFVGCSCLFERFRASTQ